MLGIVIDIIQIILNVITIVLICKLIKKKEE